METALQLGRELLLSFIPLFVAVDAVGVLPFVLTMTEDLTPRQRTRAVRSAMLTALGLGLGFLVLGRLVFSALGITVSDFLVAGGLLLLVLAFRDIILGKAVDLPAAGADEPSVGVVPLGTPLVVGPAVLAVLLLLIGQYSYIVVLIAFVLNLAIAWAVFGQANRIAGFLGPGGQRAVARIVSLLLAAIAVKMMRQGIMEILSV
ncbi:MAG: MarC family protein [Dehalococcoidia bacterium]